ncbi:MAG: hypothetical protein GF353_26250 [Candidatus Lokiarchaeota archaeon]|nr:hypothetical protein [Candidatus Lokiarchaeota archaeon]
MVFETFVIVITAYLLILIFRRYLQLKNQLTLYLFLIFLNFTLAIVFSWLAKVLYLYSDIAYLSNLNAPDPMTIESWILLRISSFRISFIFVSTAILISYFLKVKVFENEFNKVHKLLVVGFYFFTIVYAFIVYEKATVLFDVFAFVLVCVLMCAIYIPFCYRSIETYTTTEDPFIQKKLISLAIMSVSFILVFVWLTLDRLLILFGSVGYTLFYFLAWTTAIVSVLSAYIGYIRPKSQQD